ncbi:hypothetical protein EBT31_08890 [bacterium]|nr:hypothetical protein [bacterium]
MEMRIFSWNVNSLRSALEKGFKEWISEEKPDIVCLQEVRASLDKLHAIEPLFPEYKILWNPAEKSGYAGTAILSRFEPLSFETGLAGNPDPEGRSITADFGEFLVGSFYAPNAIPGTEKITKKLRWMEEFTNHLATKKGKPFFLCGDFNIAPTILDSQNTPHPRGMNGCTKEEREALEVIIKEHKLHDPMRNAAGSSLLSSWWACSPALRSMNNGFRYDYILLQTAFQTWITDQKIHHERGGSDHCPVSIAANIPTSNLKKARGGGQASLL